MRNFDAFSFKKIVAPDFFESTLPGAWLTIAGGVVMVFLFLAELRGYLTVNLTSEVTMALPPAVGAAEDLLRINFDVSFPLLSCQYLTVDLDDVLGRRKINVTSANIIKFRLDQGSGKLLSAAPAKAKAPEYGHVDHNDEEMLATALTEDTFDSFIKSNEMTLVNFYAPWCYWSQRLQPVWEHTAGLMESIDPSVKFAKVDCTDPEAENLCRLNHIQGYPSIIFFSGGTAHSHDHYHGDRTPQALLAAVAVLRTKDNKEKGLKMRQAMESMGYGESVPDEVPKNVLNDNEAADANACGGPSTANAETEDGKIAARPEGCRMSGILFVQKVPGSLTLSVHNEGQTMDISKLNTTHSVHVLSFGAPLSAEEQASLGSDAVSMMTFNNQNFSSNELATVHEHYVNVVGSRFKFLSGKVSEGYKFTVNSHQLVDSTKLPSVKFTYNLSPMTVVVSETRKPFYTFLTSACAIIGGVFTVIGLVDSAVYHGVKSIRKKIQLGKQG